MKKLINDPADVVSEALLGIEAAHRRPPRRPREQDRSTAATRPVQGKVGLISGGGSGHEPLHGGFVGLGMLDAACAGEVFTSPVPDQMLAATEAVDGGAGVLHIVKNYTGDVMNFEMAAEIAAASSGVEVVSVVTDDDVAVQDSLYTVGRRGVGVTVLVEKIAGAAAEQGRSLAEVADVARTVNSAGRSMGMALTSCTVPAAGKPTFDLPEDQMEVGIGIHGEPGRRRRSAGAGIRGRRHAARADPRRPRVLRWRRRDRVRQRHGWHAADRAVPDVQRGHEDPRQGRRHCRPVARRLLHHQPRHGRLLGHPAQGRRRAPAAVGRAGQDARPALGSLMQSDSERRAAWLEAFAGEVADNRDLLTRLDSAIGDADHGANLDRGMTAVLTSLESGTQQTPADVLKSTGMTLVSTVGGASGPLYGTFFLRMAASAGTNEDLDAAALRCSPAGRARRHRRSWASRGRRQDDVRRAGPGVRRATTPRSPRVAASLPRMAAAATAASDGRDATVDMLARKGRASYLGERSVGHQDPGATSAAMLVASAARTLG